MHLEQASYEAEDYKASETNLRNILFQRMLPDSVMKHPAGLPEYWGEHVLDALKKHGYQSCTHVSIQDAFTGTEAGEDDSKPVEPRLLNPETGIAVFSNDDLNRPAMRWLEYVGEIVKAANAIKGQLLETYEPLNAFFGKTRSMAPIRLTEYGDVLVFADPIAFDSERINPGSKLGSYYLGRHAHCGGWIIRCGRSHTHDVLRCVPRLPDHDTKNIPQLSLCGLCVPVPSGLVFYEDLFRHLHLQMLRLNSDSYLC